MSNIEISKINIDETQLLIKDAQNRQDLTSLSTKVQSISTDLTNLSASFSTDLNSLSTFISTNYLPISGGTLTGSLTTSLQTVVKDNTINTTLSPESDLWPKHFVIKDKDDTDRGYFELYQRPDTTQGIQMETKRIINDENIFNGIRLGIKEDGTRIVNISEAAIPAWQDALQVLPLSGGTMTGNLIISGGSNYKGLVIQGASGAPSLSFYNTGTRLTIDQYANGSAGGERFLLPTPESRSSDVWYAILTSKTPVTTAQGGTGGTDSGWLSLPANSTVYTGTIRYRRIGMWVEVNLYQIKLVSELTSSSGIVLNNLPSGYRPNHTVSLAAGNAATGMGLLWVGTSGNLQFFKPAGASSFPTTQNLYSTGMFLV